MTVTIKDLARMTNTSVATISRVMSNKPGVSEEKRQAIMQLAQKLGYEPNRTAQSLITKKSSLLGLVASDLRNPFYVEFLRRMDVFCKEHGYQTLVVDSACDVAKERENIKIMLQHRADGLLIFPVGDLQRQSDCDHFLELKLRKFPFILVGKLEGYAFDYVCSEEVNTGYMLARHLLDLGHRRFGLMGLEPDNRPARERTEGMLKALREEGLVGQGQTANPPSLRTVDLESPSREEIVCGWMQEPEPPTALLSINAVVTLRLLRPLAAIGVQVPRDLSIASSDDLEWCGQIIPSLTVTQAQNKTVTMTALKALMQRIADPQGPPIAREIPQLLVTRESTVPAAALVT